MTIEQTLAERGNRYGSFQDHANISQALQDVMRSEDGWERLAADQRQALTVIADKIARMLNGDPTYRDNWHDVVGYAKLVDDRMAADEASKPDTIADLVEAGWKLWNGACRKFRGDTLVDLKFRNGEEKLKAIAQDFAWRWEKGAEPWDIVAYRFSLDVQPVGEIKREWIEWSTGPRPVPNEWVIDVQFRDGRTLESIRAGDVNPKAWLWDASLERGAYVNAYRRSATPAPRT